MENAPLAAAASGHIGSRRSSAKRSPQDLSFHRRPDHRDRGRSRGSGSGGSLDRNRRLVGDRQPAWDPAAMNGLFRELAPISEPAWDEIDEEAKRTLKTVLG